MPRPCFAQAADPSDLFYNAYTANEQGETMETAGNARAALAKFRYAASLLEQISKDDPSWRAEIVAYRKKRVSANILQAQQQLPPGSATDDTAPPPPPNPGAPIEGDLPQKEGVTPGEPDLSTPPPRRATRDRSEPSAAQGSGVDALRNALRAEQKKLRAIQQRTGRDGQPPGRYARGSSTRRK